LRRLGLPGHTSARVQRSSRILERFPLAGRALTGRWQGTRFLIGPWPWTIMAYVDDEADDFVYVLAVHDVRSGDSPVNRS
jgi:hypothetical protein